MRGAHSPRDGGAGWGSPGTLSPGSRPSAQPQCGPPVYPGLRPPPGLAAGKAQGNFLQEAGCPWPGRVCRASGGALGGQTSLGRGEGAFLLPEPAGRGFPEARGGLASIPRGEPPALPAWQEGAGQQQQLCVPALLGTPPVPPPGLPPPRPRGLPSATQTRQGWSPHSPAVTPRGARSLLPTVSSLGSHVRLSA